MSITPGQSKAARALASMSQNELAAAAQVGRSTVIEFEKGARLPQKNNLDAIQRALEVAGIQFIPENGGGAEPCPSDAA